MNQYRPDRVSKPGDTIRDILRERGLDTRWLAKEMGMEIRHLVDLITGNREMELSDAEGLQKALGSPWEFWVRREADYRQSRKQR